MCGIGGYHVLEGGSPPEESEVLDLLCNLQSRGKDASGLGWIRENQIVYLKDDIPSDRLASKIEKFKTRPWGAKLPRAMMLHARQSTGGSPRKMKNNHPVLFKTGKVCVGITHNGIISNHDEAFRQLQVQKVTEVDSEAIGAALAIGLEASKDWATAVGPLEKLRGSAAFAAMSPERSDMLIARTSSSPLVVAYEEPRHIIWWASEAWMLPAYQILEKFGTKWSKIPLTRTLGEGEGLVLSKDTVTPITVPKMGYPRLSGYTGEGVTQLGPHVRRGAATTGKGASTSTIGLYSSYTHPARTAWVAITTAAGTLHRESSERGRTTGAVGTDTIAYG